MAPIANKTYSRKKAEVFNVPVSEKENLDPFDELLSSPLKQDVDFKPISFWNQKSRGFKNKSNHTDEYLFNSSDSEELSPSLNKIKKFKTNFVKKRKEIRTKSTSSFLKDSNQNKKSLSKYNAQKNKISELKNNIFTMEDKIYQVIKSPQVIDDRYVLKKRWQFNKMHWSGNIKNNIECTQEIKKINETELNKNSNKNDVNRKKKSTKLLRKKGIKDTDLNSITYIISNFSSSLGFLTNCEEPVKTSSTCDSPTVTEPGCTLQHTDRSESENSFFHLFCSSFNNTVKTNCVSCSLIEKKTHECQEKISISFDNSTEDTEEIRSSNLRQNACIFVETANCNYGRRDSTLAYHHNYDNKYIKINSNFEDDVSPEILVQDDTDYKISKDEAHKSNDFTFSHIQNDNSQPSYSVLYNTILSSHPKESFVTKNAFNSPENCFNEKDKCSFSKSDSSQSIIHSTSTSVASLVTMVSDMKISNDNNKSYDKLKHKNNYIENLDTLAKKKKATYLSPLGTRNSDGRSCVSRNVVTRKRFVKMNQKNQVSLFNSISNEGTNKNLCDRSGMRDLDSPKSLESTFFKEAEISRIIGPEMNSQRKVSLDSSRFSSFPSSVFESTRIQENCTNNTEENAEHFASSLFEKSIALKPGKKCFRSMSVLRQLQNQSLPHLGFSTTDLKGRSFQVFMKEVIDMQKEISDVLSPNSSQSSSEVYGNTTVKEMPIELRNKSTLGNHSFQQSRLSADDSNMGYYSFSKTTNKSSCRNKTFMSHTIKVLNTEGSFSQQSSFRSALGLQQVTLRVEGDEDKYSEEISSISARDFILAQCGQEDVLPFEEYFNERTLKNCKKIGEGVYGEVFMYNSDTVLKIIPIEGQDKVNGEPQKTFEEILSEVVIAMKLSNLRSGKTNQTYGFSELKRCWCVVGAYPDYLLNLWYEYDKLGNGSDNDSPEMFNSDQLYIILELANGGKDLEAFVFNSAEQSLSVFIQTAFSLAAAEKEFEFEHRDLHWGNLLIAPTKEKFMTVTLDGNEYKILTKGVKVSIIDFTLSRIIHEGVCIFNDLSVDPELFASHGDYQFDIYRMMQNELGNNWSVFKPKNNIFWLHYVLDKMIKLVRYKNVNTQNHRKYIKCLEVIEKSVLHYSNSSEFVVNGNLLQGTPATNLVEDNKIISKRSITRKRRTTRSKKSG